MTKKIVLGLLFSAMLFLIACGGDNKTYATSESQYIAGWILHNVDSNTPDVLDYSPQDFAVYNYSYHFPGDLPNYQYGVTFVIPPWHRNSNGLGSAAIHMPIATPFNKKLYMLFNEPDAQFYRAPWQFDNYIMLNNVKSGNKDIEMTFDFYSTEQYKGWFTPRAGEKKTVYFGKAPYTPASFVVQNGVVTLNGHLLRGYNNDSYIARPAWVGYGSTTTYFPQPSYAIYLNNKLVKEGFFGDEYTNFDYTKLRAGVSESGTYTISVMIPINYTVWNAVRIDAEIKSPSQDMEPPEFIHLEIEPRFTPNTPLPIEVEFDDESGIKNVQIFVYRENAWKPIETAKDTDDKNKKQASPTLATRAKYKALFIPSENLEKIDLKITATDSSGNSVTYTILPAALPIRQSVLNLETQKSSANRGDTIYVFGRCTDNWNGNCRQRLVKYYVNGEFIKNDMVYGRTDNMITELSWQIPENFTDASAVITARMEPVGVYDAVESSVTIPVSVLEYDVGVFDMTVKDTNEPFTKNVSAVIKNIGTNTQKNINVDFAVYDDKQETKKIEELKSGQSVPVNFIWKARWATNYELSISAKTERDDNTQNNKQKIWYEVVPFGADIALSLSVPSRPIVDAQDNITLYVYNFGSENAEQVHASIYELYAVQNEWVEYEQKNSSKEGIEKENPKNEKQKLRNVIIYNGTKYLITAKGNDTSAELFISTEQFNETVHFAEDKPFQRLQNEIIIYAEYFNPLEFGFIIGNGEVIAEKEIGVMKSGSETKFAFNWTPQRAGPVLVAGAISTPSLESYLGNNRVVTDAKVIRQGINLAGDFIREGRKQKDSISDYRVGKTGIVRTEIENIGQESAQNVRVSLYHHQPVLEKEKNVDEKVSEENLIGYKDVLIAQTKIPKIDAGKSQEINFSWTPSSVGDASLLLLIEAKGDVDPSNNDEYEYFYVLGSGPDVAPDRIYTEEYYPVVGSQTIVNTRVYNLDTANVSDVSVALYEGTGDKRVLIGEQKIDKILAQRSAYKQFNWTPTSSGRHELEVVATVAEDTNPKNNVYTDSVYVYSEKSDVALHLYSNELVLEGKPAFAYIFFENIGTEQTAPFNISLKANGEVVAGYHSDGLDGTQSWFTFLEWTPKSSGVYTLLASADITDSNSENNIATGQVTVAKAKEITIVLNTSDEKDSQRIVSGPLYSVDVNTGEPTVIEIPDIAQEIWVGKSMQNGGVAMVYKQAQLPQATGLRSAHSGVPQLKDGLMIYEVFAVKGNWDYTGTQAFISKTFDELITRHTELGLFVCADYNFVNASCREWVAAESEGIFSGGDIIMSAKADDAVAFALGEPDYDGDGNPDWDDTDSDNDGVPDENDKFICHEGRLKSRHLINITSNTSTSLQNQQGAQKVGFKDKGKNLAEFTINFSKDKVDCRQIDVQKQPAQTSRGYTIVSGLNLTNQTKTVYVDKIAGRDRVCVKDAEVNSVEEVSKNCNGADEYLILCDGNLQSGYRCVQVNGSGSNQYKVEGLHHSAVVEPTTCEESWSCGDWGSCSDKKQTRTCTEKNNCGTSFNKPSEEQDCTPVPAGSSGGGGGSFAAKVIDLKNIESLAEGASKNVIARVRDKIIFTFGAKSFSMELGAVKGSFVSLNMSSETKPVIINRGTAAEFDINHDGTADITVKYDSIDFDRVTLVLTRVNKQVPQVTAQVTAAPTPEILPAPTTTVAAETDTGRPSKKIFTPQDIRRAGIILFALIAVVVIIGGISIIRRKMVQKKVQYAQVQEKHIGQIEEYIQKERDKGASSDKIKNALIKTGWSKDVVESAMKKFK